MKIVTNNHMKMFKYGYEVPTDVHADYNWLDGDERQDGWIKYRDSWLHISDFMRTSDDDFKGWDGYMSDTYFSGVVIRHVSDGVDDGYVIGRYMS